MRWMEHVVHMEDMHTVFWLENLEESYHLENLGIDGKIILEWILIK